jgi:glycosyltransferase involved in cell wall biosynthesis
VPGEIIVADNGSTDGSPAIAQKLGARVVPVKEKGYGAALGKWILMGDADDSYDFSEADRFVKKFREGFELVMGCRLPAGGGTILPGAKTSFNSARFSRPPFRWHSIRQRLEMGL